jgi:hypothetical protein
MRMRIPISFVVLSGLPLFPQGPAAPPDPAVLQALLQRHRPAPRVFEFAAIGDQQYGPEGEQKWPALQNSINRAANLAFTVHAGDFKSGSTECSNELFADRLQAFNNFEMPLVYTPGDNEWTDCHRENNGSYNSLERLDYLRRIFFPDNRSLGRQKVTLSRQSEDPRYSRYVENAMWSTGNILFATLHVVGSNNNVGRDAENDREYQERTAANFNWVKTVFNVARDNGFAGVVIVTQANPGWNGTPVPVSALGSGFRDTFFVLEDEVIVSARPVLVIMGDTHRFRIDKPLLGARSGRILENLMRVEVPGDTSPYWVRVRVDPAKAGLFSFEHEEIVENYVQHQRP